ncbi:hypothetical protein SPRG_04627 [Saprolegnia parasitica CBS 223.65]|uniref:Uncharacterized protein n=1 Tax=Saprolegnia parasitica (strain CBS 223.65) TaxID=695850 RepID=A0A067CW46_SAPPC|nr:hypothetical protein SPRG_04627 [Saprolegnia parasitica CBS 223.65]KDO30726.1 hypothetical protein SPRG_04627 [Saprolegnia parasitica CBS 223.65]|eukprot:XP_012198426.1 hypothetical protein SPRG_04627 [Saprolegnia parasitica CBS 223.65]
MIDSTADTIRELRADKSKMAEVARHVKTLVTLRRLVKEAQEKAAENQLVADELPAELKASSATASTVGMDDNQAESSGHNDAAVAALNDEKKKLEASLEAAKKSHLAHTAALEDEKKKLQASLKEAKEAHATAVAALHKNTQDLEATLAELTIAKEARDASSTNNDADRQRLATELEVVTAKLISLETSYKSVQDELSRESQRYAIELETANNFHKRFQNDLKKVTQERQDLEKSLKTAADDHAFAIQGLEDALAASRAELEKESQGFFLLKASEADLKRQLETLETTLQERLAAGNKATEELAVVQRQLSQTDILLTQAHQELDREAKRWAKDLEAEKCALARAQDELRKVVDAKADIIAKLKSSMTEVDTLRAALSSALATQKESTDAIVKLRAEGETSQSLLASLAADFQAQKTEIEQWKATAEALTSDRQQLLLDLDTAKAEALILQETRKTERAVAESHKEHLFETQAASELLAAKFEALQATHAAIVTDKTALELTVTVLAEEKACLVEAAALSSEKIAHLESVASSSTSEVVSLKTELTKVTNDYHALQRSYAVTATENTAAQARIEAELATEKARSATAKKAADQATVLRKLAEESASGIKTKVATLEADLKQKEVEAKEWKQASATLRKEVAVLTVANDKLAAESKQALAEAERLHAATDAIKEEWIRFRKENGKLAETIAELRKARKVTTEETKTRELPSARTATSQSMEQQRNLLIAFIVVVFISWTMKQILF